jgi:hypothetical protein
MGRFNFVQNQQAPEGICAFEGGNLRDSHLYTTFMDTRKIQDVIGTTPINLIEAEY